jgi:hypothetical protein
MQLQRVQLRRPRRAKNETQHSVFFAKQKADAPNKKTGERIIYG